MAQGDRERRRLENARVRALRRPSRCYTAECQEILNLPLTDTEPAPCVGSAAFSPARSPLHLAASGVLTSPSVYPRIRHTR
jgi:hypothetical protein